MKFMSLLINRIPLLVQKLFLVPRGDEPCTALGRYLGLHNCRAINADGIIGRHTRCLRIIADFDSIR